MKPLPRLACAALLAGALALPAAAGASPPATPLAATAALTGTVRQPGTAAGLPGMVLQITEAACPDTSTSGCTTTAATGAAGRFTISGLAPGSYRVTVQDGAATDQLTTVTLSAGAEQSVTLTLPAPAVPALTVAHHALRDLRWLNAARVAHGLPGGVVLNPRWSAECAAHDAYEHAAGVLDASEDPTAPLASAGGAWAALNADLAQGSWSATRSPWQMAPVHLLALMAPSLAVTGIDDADGLQCAITWPGMERASVSADTISTDPGPGVSDVATSETALETPFTPVQFAGLPAGQPTGPELFVYLNQAGATGQAAVEIVSASLTQAGRPVAVRWVDHGTATLGPYLAGAIVIPADPLKPHATYHASVTVRDGSQTLTHRWAFTTAE
jgi:hypothetical protein